MYPNFRARENYLIQNFLKLLYIITKNDKIEMYNIYFIKYHLSQIRNSNITGDEVKNIKIRNYNYNKIIMSLLFNYLFDRIFKYFKYYNTNKIYVSLN